MKIDSISPAGTAGSTSIVFNLAAPVDSVALSRVRLDGVWLGVRGQLLSVESKEPITAELVERIRVGYAEAKAKLEKETEAEHAKRAVMLQAVAKSTGVVLEAA